jgi:hypothetical protein
LDNDTTLLLDLDGLAVASVERLQDGIRRGAPDHRVPLREFPLPSPAGSCFS